MTEASTQFARDRTKFLRLVRQLVNCLQDAIERDDLGDSIRVIIELDESDVSARLGFGRAFFISQEVAGYGETTLCIFFNRPYGAGGGRVPVSKTKAKATRSVWREDDVDRLLDAASAWMELATNLEEIDPYPAVPNFKPPDAPVDLWADSLWRELYYMRSSLEKDSPSLWRAENYYWSTSCFSKLGTLAREARMPGFAPFTRGPTSKWVVNDSDGSPVYELKTLNGGFARPGPEDLRRVIRCIENWLETRKRQVRERAAPTKRQRRRGAPRRHSGEQDRRLVEDWRASGMTKPEFEHARGIEPRSVKRAQDRLKHRQ